MNEGKWKAKFFALVERYNQRGRLSTKTLIPAMRRVHRIVLPESIHVPDITQLSDARLMATLNARARSMCQGAGFTVCYPRLLLSEC